jgi:phenylalanyl-tRNA synthetase alpha chain
MSYTNNKVVEVATALKNRFKQLEAKSDILKAIELKALYAEIPTLEPSKRKDFGREINALKQELQQMVDEHQEEAEKLPPIDVTAPFAPNTVKEERPQLFTTDQGSKHPLTAEMERINDIFYRMGFEVVESRQIDDDYHMFGSLNFPEGHPARDDYDTFMTEDGLIAPAHTSTMQNRVLKERKEGLENDTPIAVVIPGRVFRNEDLDATHEHTFHQLEGVYVAKGANVGNLVATLQTYLSEYFGEDLKAKIQPFYFPFTEPSFEFAVERPEVLRKDDSEEQRWLELGGCGMIHPNVLREAGIDPEVYTGFAWGFGIERMVLMRYEIEDIRHFNSGKLDFLRQF